MSDLKFYLIAIPASLIVAAVCAVLSLIFF